MPYVDIGPDHGVGFVIRDLWAFVAVHDDGDEGLVGMTIQGKITPMVAADRERLDMLRPYAEQVARESNKVIKLVRFTTREDVEVLNGD